MRWMKWWNASAYTLSIHEERRLSLDIVQGKVFGSWSVAQPDMLGIVFMPLALGADCPASVAQVYEYIDKAGPRCINGMPIFTSCRLISHESWVRVRQMVADLVRQQHEFLEGT